MIIWWVILSVLIIFARAGLLVLPRDECGKKYFARIHRGRL